MTILDHNGRPISSAALLEEDNDGEFDDQSALLWYDHNRSVANNLTPRRAAALIRAVDEGDDVHSFMTLAEEIEERDRHYFACARNRKVRISHAVPIVDDNGADPKIVEAVTMYIAKWNLLGSLVYAMMDGVAKGYSVIETLWDRGQTWKPKGFRWRRPEYYRFNRRRQVRRVDLDQEWNEGEPLEAGKYIVHVPMSKEGQPRRNGLARLGLSAYVCKSFNETDLQRFIELYGMPARIGRYEGELNRKERRRLLAATIALGHDAAAILPKSQEIELLDGRRGTDVDTFLKSAKHWDEQTSKMWLGGTMTIDNGSSKSQASVHQGGADSIAVHDSTSIGITVNRDLVKVFVDVNFGTQEFYPALRWPVRIHGDLTKFTAAMVPLADRGVRISERWVLETIGAPTPVDGERFLSARTVSVGGQGPSGDTPGDTTPADDDDEVGADDGETGVADE